MAEVESRSGELDMNDHLCIAYVVAPVFWIDGKRVDLSELQFGMGTKRQVEVKTRKWIRDVLLPFTPVSGLTLDPYGLEVTISKVSWVEESRVFLLQCYRDGTSPRPDEDWIAAGWQLEGSATPV